MRLKLSSGSDLCSGNTARSESPLPRHFPKLLRGLWNIDFGPYSCYNDSMHQIIFSFVENLSLVIGAIGIVIIAVGAFKGLYHYVVTRDEHNFQHARLVLGSHIILGLDFMVGKDIIDTILLDSGAEFWRDLAGLITVVSIRIVLTHFMLQEVRLIRQSEEDVKKK